MYNRGKKITMVIIITDWETKDRGVIRNVSKINGIKKTAKDIVRKRPQTVQQSGLLL